MFTNMRRSLASASLSEQVGGEESGIAYRLTRLRVASICRSWTLSELRGYHKARVAADRILSFTAFRPQGARSWQSSRSQSPQDCYGHAPLDQDPPAMAEG